MYIGSPYAVIVIKSYSTTLIYASEGMIAVAAGQSEQSRLVA